MPIYTAARGTVVDAPVSITTDVGVATVLVLRDARPSGTSEAGEPRVDYQVCVREPGLVEQVLKRVHLGDRLIALGALQLDVVTGPLEDPLSAARVTLEAVAAGLELAPVPT